MNSKLLDAARLVQNAPRFAAFNIQCQEEELILAQEGERFARLQPGERPEEWRLEYFRNRECWDFVNFVGRLEECLDFLDDRPRYKFWEG